MFVRNKSLRPHWVGDVLIAPGEVKEIAPEFEAAFNKFDLEEVETRADEVVVESADVEVKPRGRKNKLA